MLVNLTFLAVNSEIDQFLSDFQDFSSIGSTEIELRIKLMVFILPRCHDRYKWVEKDEQFPFSVDIPPAPLAQRLEIEALILTAIDLFKKQKKNDSEH